MVALCVLHLLLLVRVLSFAVCVFCLLLLVLRFEFCVVCCVLRCLMIALLFVSFLRFLLSALRFACLFVW